MENYLCADEYKEFYAELMQALNIDLNECDIESVSVCTSKTATTENFIINIGNKTIKRSIKLGSLLVKFLPVEPIEVNEDTLDEQRAFKQILYNYYTLCNNKSLNYTEDVFRAYFTNMDYFVPAYKVFISDNFMSNSTLSKFEFDEDKDLIASLSPYNANACSSEMIGLINSDFTFYRAYDLKKIIPTFLPDFIYEEKLAERFFVSFELNDYILAIAYELMKHKLKVNKCAECGKWFIAKKSDTKYCDKCKKDIKRLQDDMSILKSRYIARCKKREKSPDKYNKMFPEDKEWYDLEAKIAEECYKAKTKAEIEACIKWIKSLKKLFPKAKGD